MDKIEKELNLYRKTFNDNFPTFAFSSKSPDEIAEIINECVKKKKDVYDMGYLTLDDDVEY